MKVVSWNLLKFSASKLTTEFSAKFQSFQLGNNVLDYITNVVLGKFPWDEVVSQTPADVFVVIELVTGGAHKGDAVSGNCETTLKTLTNALNTAVQGTAGYVYDFVIPLVTGKKETVGFIFNTEKLTLQERVVEWNTVTNRYLLPRSPLVATFQLKANNLILLTFSGIHDSPPSGAASVRMRIPINYCAQLVHTAAATRVNSFFLGDFNCEPSNFYSMNNTDVYPFSNLIPLGYECSLPNHSLSSVRKRINSDGMGDNAYLNAAYDNVIYRTDNNQLKVTKTYIPDLIGEAKNCSVTPPVNIYSSHSVATLNAFRKVSDHLPVILEFDVV